MINFNYINFFRSNVVIRFIKSFLVLGAVLFSQSSYALIDAQVLLGVSQINLDLGSKGDLNASGVRVAAHLDPIPLVPVAFGFSYGMITGENSDKFSLIEDGDFLLKETEGHELALEIMVWSPIDLFGVTPYAKAGYVVFGGYRFGGSYTAVDQNVDLDLLYGTSGSLVTLGLKWAPLPLVGLLFEAQNVTSNLSFDKLENAAGTGLSSPKASATSWSYMVGLEVGI